MKSEPGGWLQETCAGPQLSVADTWKSTAMEICPRLIEASTEMGQEICGGVVSPCTVTVKPQEAEFSAPSVAEQVTAVWPTGKVEPEACEQETCASLQLSVADTLK
jgi:hypothetical protein